MESGVSTSTSVCAVAISSPDRDAELRAEAGDILALIGIAGIPNVREEPQDRFLVHAAHTGRTAHGATLDQGGEDADAIFQRQAIHNTYYAYR